MGCVVVEAVFDAFYERDGFTPLLNVGVGRLHMGIFLGTCNVAR